MKALEAAQAKMRADGQPQQAIDVFSSFYRQLEHGASGIIAEADVDPLAGIVSLSSLNYDTEQLRAAAAQTVVIKLNGGLGTGMGMEQAKSLLPVKHQLSFLDLIIDQIKHVRSTLDVQTPLLFMNSFRTREDTLAVLAKHPGIEVEGLPLDFVQNREPKLLAETLEPVSWPKNPSLEWCPPGHADIYTALDSSGILDQLLAAGMRYASISNSDNLGANPDPAMMAWFAESGAPYAAEVCRRTPADVKGGYLVVRKSDGRLILRETAQTADEDAERAADLSVHRYFHTNNLWFDLQALRRELDRTAGVLDLPLIRNVKNVDPTDSSSPKVIQIESAMGAAVSVFDGAQAIEVDRARFLPVKSTNDLLLLRSDVYDVGSDYQMRSRLDDVPSVDLDSKYYKTIADFDKRIAFPVSLVHAESFKVRGDWTFGEGVVVRGKVELTDEGGPRHIESGTVLSGV